MDRMVRNIAMLKDHFKRSYRDHRDLPSCEENTLTELQETLLSQDAYIRDLVPSAEHNSALYQAKRLVEMLQQRPH